MNKSIGALVFIFGVFVTFIFLSNTKSFAEYELAPDDPILTYRVDDSKLWHETVLHNINAGLLNDKVVAKEMCQAIKGSWSSDYNKYGSLNYDEFTTRMQVQMNLVDTELYRAPVILKEYISYYFLNSSNKCITS